MAKTQVLRYWIHLTDPALVATLNTELDAGGGATVNPHGSIIVASGLDNGLNQAPDNASSSIAPALDPPGPAPIIAQGAAMQSPGVSSEWFTTEFNFPQDVATFSRKSGGWFGIASLFGTTTNFYWSGRFVYTPPSTAVTDTTGAEIADPAPIPGRYFLETFELPLVGNGGSGTKPRHSRDASGFVEGYGIGFRHSNTSFDRQTFEYLPGGVTTAPQKVWERMYYTLRALPTIPQLIHYTQGYPSSSNGTALVILPTGQLAAYILDISAGAVLLGTMATPLTLGRRYKIDHLIKWRKDNSGAGTVDGTGQYRIYVSGVQVFNSGLILTGPGSAISRQQVSSLAQVNALIAATADTNYEADIDYWHCADIPQIEVTPGVYAESLTSIDWLQGSRGVLLEASGQAADFSAVGWTASKYRSLSRRPAARSDSQLASTTALSIASFTVDVLTRVRNIRQAVGMASMVVGLYSFRGTTSGRLGFKLNGGANTWTSITQVAGPNPGWNTALYQGPSTTLALTPTALEIKHEKGNDATAGGIQLLAACVELIGIFGAEDLPADARDQAVVAGFNRRMGVHNSAYPDTPWGGGGGGDPTFGALAIFSGTYTGNGTTQDVALKHAPCFVVVRRVSGSADIGAFWTTGLLGAKIDIEQGTNPAITCLRDPAYAGATALDEQELGYLLRIGNNHAQVNTLTATYHYVAICDPAGRFFLSAADSHNSSASVLPKTQSLPVDGWTPVFAMAFQEVLNNTSTDGVSLKSSGLTAPAVVVLATAVAETLNALTFGAGEFIERIGLNSSTTFDQLSYLFGRLDDGNGPFAVPPFGCVAYIGDGTASRTVGMNLGGKRPVWGISSGNPGYQRDPSHTGSNSSRFTDGTETAVGITGGGIDSVSVGAGLNSNGVPYVLFALPGSATAGNNGWSIDGDFWPIEPDSAVPDAGWVEPVLLDNDEVDTEPDIPDDLSTDLAAACVDWTTKIANMALSRIGQSQPIVTLATEATEAATLVRLHYGLDVETVLRDFPWPFATRYAALVLVDGDTDDPVNDDWTFSYRYPVDLLYARRLVKQDGQKRKPDPSPTPFRPGSDATGGLIYTDAEATATVPLQLEYTIRMACPASAGDPLFRDALAWKLAHSLAAPLAKNEKTVAYCWGMYQNALAKAEPVSASESQPEKDADAPWISGR